MSRETLIAHTPFGLRRAHQRLDEIAHESIPAGHTLTIKVEVDSGPTARMRGKFHAMCQDIAEQVIWCGSKQDYLRWKAVFIGAAVAQEWIPGIDGRPVPFRKGSEDLTRKQYCDCIAIAQVFGDEHHVQWSEQAKEDA